VSELLENYCAVVAARNQMRIWGCSPPQKKGLNFGIEHYSRNGESPERFSEMADPRKSPPWGST